MIYRQDGKKWVLPNVLRPEGKPGCFFYSIIGFREPLVGEYFISGNPHGMYLARHDLGTKYLVARVGKKAKLTHKWVEVDGQ